MSWFWQKTHRRLQPEKKIVPEPCQPGKAILLAEVREVGGDHRLASDAAEAGAVGEAIDLAFAGTHQAPLRPEQGQRPARPLLERA
jgi:hypothetical protein